MLDNFIHLNIDTMIDWGFVIAAFVPLVLLWMYVLISTTHGSWWYNNLNPSASV